MKKIIKITLFGILFFIVIISILILTKGFFLDNIINFIMNLRGTEHYEGETRSSEALFIMFYLIFPFVFIITIGITYLFNRKFLFQ